MKIISLISLGRAKAHSSWRILVRCSDCKDSLSHL
jgi:hypothetical protein